MKSQEILYLSKHDVEAVGLPMPRIIQALEEMFIEKGHHRVEMPPKPGIHPMQDAFIHAMPAYIPSMKSAGMKWVSGFPENQKKHLPYISGLLILNDPQTGIPIAIMDCTWITGKRTGAATAVAAKHLARPESSQVGIVACGVQGRDNLEALATVFKIKKVKAYDLYPEVAQKFTQEMSRKLDLEIEAVRFPEEAVRKMDIVVTSGPILKKPAPVIEAQWFESGSFASPVDFDSYWKPEALNAVDWLVTDDIQQMEYYRQSGYFQKTPSAHADLGEVVAGMKRGRQNESEKTMAINLGIALDDMATAVLIYKAAMENNLGTRLPL